MRAGCHCGQARSQLARKLLADINRTILCPVTCDWLSKKALATGIHCVLQSACNLTLGNLLAGAEGLQA